MEIYHLERKGARREAGSHITVLVSARRGHLACTLACRQESKMWKNDSLRPSQDPVSRDTVCLLCNSSLTCLRMLLRGRGEAEGVGSKAEEWKMPTSILSCL